MTSSQPRRAIRRGFFGAALLAAVVGCSGEGGAPTKIYDGGGTIPDIVDQPEPAAPKPAKGAKGAPRN
jgi:nitrous oxide reductase